MRRHFSTSIQIKKDSPALFTISAGLLAGFIHVLIGPDHLAALAPMAADQRHRAWITGFRWGIGHSSGVLLIGILVLIFREIVPVNLISTYSERVVGVVLIAIGIWALRKTMNQHVHTHPHSHDGKDHVHIHMHTSVPKHRHTHAALAVGALHGLARSSHIFGILPALALPSFTLAVGYITAFGMGTVFGMVLFSSLIGKLSTHFSSSTLFLYKGFMTTCAVAAILIGRFWLMG